MGIKKRICHKDRLMIQAKLKVCSILTLYVCYVLKSKLIDTHVPDSNKGHLKPQKRHQEGDNLEIQSKLHCAEPYF